MHRNFNLCWSMNNKTAVPPQNEITHHRAMKAEEELTYIWHHNCTRSGFHAAEFTLDSKNKAAPMVQQQETWFKAVQ